MTKKRRSPEKEAAEAVSTSLTKDVEQFARAMARIKDPTMRYMLTLFVDMASQRIAQLEAAPVSSPSELELAATKH